MADRIARHVARRPPEWETVEAGDDLAATILTDGTTLIDGLGGWVAGALHRGGTPEQITWSIDQVLKAGVGGGAPTAGAGEAGAGAGDQTHVIVVAEEAGQGLLPMDAVSPPGSTRSARRSSSSPPPPTASTTSSPAADPAPL